MCHGVVAQDEPDISLSLDPVSDLSDDLPFRPVRDLRQGSISWIEIHKTPRDALVSGGSYCDTSPKKA